MFITNIVAIFCSCRFQSWRLLIQISDHLYSLFLRLQDLLCVFPVNLNWRRRQLSWWSCKEGITRWVWQQCPPWWRFVVVNVGVDKNIVLTSSWCKNIQTEWVRGRVPVPAGAGPPLKLNRFFCVIILMVYFVKIVWDHAFSTSLTYKMFHMMNAGRHVIRLTLFCRCCFWSCDHGKWSCVEYQLGHLCKTGDENMLFDWTQPQYQNIIFNWFWKFC